MELPRHTFPAGGHINSILSITIELVKTKKCHVVIYCGKEYRDKIESAGAEFRAYENNFTLHNFKTVQNNSRRFDVVYEKTMSIIIDSIKHNALKLAKDIDNEKPSLILYDQVALYVKYAFRMIQTYRNKKINRHIFQPKSSLPPIISYSTTFCYYSGIYPNQTEVALFSQPTFLASLKLRILYYYYSFKQFIFCWKYGLQYHNPFSDSFKIPDELNLVFVSPYFQARSHLFPEEFKFVGSCISESVHHDGLLNKNDESINLLLKQYDPRNPVDDVCAVKNDQRKLIYASLGTFLNNNKELILTIIDAFVEFDIDDSQYRYKLNQLDIIISVRDDMFSKEEKLNLPKNIYLMEGVPQLEVLKRASLFITHCGMNSVSEAIHYGVPLVCLPIAGDQLLISYRATVDLGLGIELQYLNIESKDIRKAVKKILSDSRYHERTLLQSKLSRKYDGGKLSAKEIIEFAKF